MLYWYTKKSRTTHSLRRQYGFLCFRSVTLHFCSNIKIVYHLLIQKPLLFMVLKWYNLSIEGGLTMPTIIPIKELKNTSTISDICHSVNEPIFITKNGYGDMVLMSMETYENYIHRQQIYRELEISEQQIIDGKTMDAKDSVKKLREKYGI